MSINLNELARGGTVCLGNAAIIIDASAKADAEVTPATVDYAINGIAYTFTSGDGDVPLDGNTVTTAYTVLFLVVLSTAGAVTVVKGTEVLTANLTNGTAVLHWPTATINTCPIGAIKVANASGAVFTGGTTLLDAAGITTTCYNFFCVPAAPLTS